MPSRIPQVARFSRSFSTTVRERSTKVTHRAPRLSASIPTDPVPAHKSRKRAPTSCGCRMLNKDSFNRSGVGRTSRPESPFSRRPLYAPAITRTKPSYRAPRREAMREEIEKPPAFPSKGNFQGALYGDTLIYGMPNNRNRNKNRMINTAIKMIAVWSACPLSRIILASR